MSLRLVLGIPFWTNGLFIPLFVVVSLEGRLDAELADGCR